MAISIRQPVLKESAPWHNVGMNHDSGVVLLHRKTSLSLTQHFAPYERQRFRQRSTASHQTNLLHSSTVVLAHSRRFHQCSARKTELS